jgi:hypothetical protein
MQDGGCGLWHPTMKTLKIGRSLNLKENTKKQLGGMALIAIMEPATKQS